MDKYNILRKLGQGTYGSVYLCEQKDSGRQCVMKRMVLRNLSEKERSSALQEAQLLESLNHPNIVAYVDTVCTRSKLYLLMQFCDGGDLEHKLNDVRKEKGMVPDTQVLDWFVQMALALQYLHSKRILHRDLKTANVFLTAIGIVKLGDFGVSRVLSATTELAKTFVGTPYYLSPELLNNSPYGQASDVWALGVIFYEMCTLAHPYEAKTFPALAQKILHDPPPLIEPLRTSAQVEELEKLSAAMLCKDSEVRPSLPELLEFDVVQARMQAFVEEAQLSVENPPLVSSVQPVCSPSNLHSQSTLQSSESEHAHSRRNTSHSIEAHRVETYREQDDDGALQRPTSDQRPIAIRGHTKHDIGAEGGRTEPAAIAPARSWRDDSAELPGPRYKAQGTPQPRSRGPLDGEAGVVPSQGQGMEAGSLIGDVNLPCFARRAQESVSNAEAGSPRLSTLGSAATTPFKRGSRRQGSFSKASGIAGASTHSLATGARGGTDQSVSQSGHGLTRLLTPDERLAEIDRKQRELQAQMSQLQVAKQRMELEASMRASLRSAPNDGSLSASYAGDSTAYAAPQAGASAGRVAPSPGDTRAIDTGLSNPHFSEPKDDLRPTLVPAHTPPATECQTLSWPSASMESSHLLPHLTSMDEFIEPRVESVQRSLEEWNECFAGRVQAPKVLRDMSDSPSAEREGSEVGIQLTPSTQREAWRNVPDPFASPSAMMETLRESSAASGVSQTSMPEEYEDDFESDDEDEDSARMLGSAIEEDVASVLRRISLGDESNPSPLGGLDASSSGYFGSFAAGQSLLELEATVRQLRQEVAEKAIEQERMDMFSATLHEVASRLTPTQPATRNGPPACSSYR